VLLVGIIFLALVIGRVALAGPLVRQASDLSIQVHLALALIAPVALWIGSYSVSNAAFMLGFAGMLIWVYEAIRIPSVSGFSIPTLKSLRTFSAIEWISLAVVTCIFALSIIGLDGVPLTSWDAAVAHASLPATYVRLDEIRLLPGNVYSAYPQLIHTLGALDFTYYDKFEVGPANWLLSVFACGAVYGLAHRIGGRTAGLIAAAMFATSPIFIAQLSTVAIDVPFTGFIASALLALVIWGDTKSVRYLIAAGAIAGAACGIRHSGYLAAFLMFVWVVIQSKDNRAKLSAIFAASVAIASAPWWLRSWVLVGNPVYPLLTSVFGDGGMPDVQVTAPLQHETAQHAGILDFLTFPWRIAMHPESFDGWQASPGGLVLALGVVGVLWGGRMARWLGGFSLAGILTIYMVQRFARYLLPFFMPLQVTGALAAVRPGPLRRPIAVLLVLTYIYGLGLAVATSYQKWPVVFGRESREEYLTRRVERYPAFQWVNAHVPEDAVVLTLDPRSFYIQRESFQNLAALEELRGKPVDEQLAWMAARRIRYILVPDAYVAGSPIFRERGLAPLIDQWRADARFRAVYDEQLPDPRGGGTERVTILEVVGGDGGGPA